MGLHDGCENVNETGAKPSQDRNRTCKAVALILETADELAVRPESEVAA